MLVILKIICYMAIGGFMGHLGYPVIKWEFWFVMILVIFVDILSALRMLERNR